MNGKTPIIPENTNKRKFIIAFNVSLWDILAMLPMATLGILLAVYFDSIEKTTLMGMSIAITLAVVIFLNITDKKYRLKKYQVIFQSFINLFISKKFVYGGIDGKK